jgi:predicted DNA-binding transcriptional regulator YafY
VNRTDRLYALVEELRARAPRPVTAPDLARRFEVSVRTVERDIQALLEAGVPIWTERGRRGGYTLDPATTLPPLNLTTREATTIVIALSALGTSPFSDAGRSARQKIVAVMSERDSGDLAALTHRIRVAAPAANVDPAVLDIVREAVEQRTVLEITYDDRHDTRTRRQVEAHGLYTSDGTWALVAWCRLRDGGRVFRLDRIVEVATTGERAPDRDFATVLGWMPPDFHEPDLVE